MTVLAGTVAITNVIGVRGAAWAIDFFTIAKLAPLALLIVLGLPQIDAGTIAGQAVADPDWTEAILIMMFAFGGFESALLPAGEMRDPKRDIGFALLVGLAIITTVYVLVQVVVVGVIAEAAEAKAPLAAALGVLLDLSGLILASVRAMVSVYGWMASATFAAIGFLRLATFDAHVRAAMDPARADCCGTAVLPVCATEIAGFSRCL